MTTDATFDAHMSMTRNVIYTACEDLDFTWSETEVKKFDEAWRSGYPIDMIADSFNRNVDEVFILAIDRAVHGHIRRRPNGLWGHLPTEKERKKRLGQNQRQAILRLLSSGASAEELAIVADVNPNTIRKIENSEAVS